MPSATIVVRDIKPMHQRTWANAFSEGLRRHGWRVCITTTYAEADLVAMWGVHRSDWIRRQRAHGGEIVIMERGYMGDRFQWTSVSFGGGLNGRGVYRGPLDDPSRWEKHFAHLMQPWRQREGYALILGQVPGDSAVKGADMPGFYAKAKAAFEALGYETRFRPHPQNRPCKPIAEDLDGAALAVTWNSTSGVDAVLAGVPTVAMDEGSMAWPVAGHELAVPPTPDRAAWAHAMAWKQWRLDEMASGECWEAIGKAG